MAGRSSRPPAPPTFGPATALLRELKRLRLSEDLLRTQNEELLEAQAQLERVRDDLAELYDNAALPLVTLDGQGLLQRANVAAAELFELPRVALVGRLLRTFVHELDRSRFSGFLARADQDAHERCEVRLTLPGGSLVPCELRQRSSGQRRGGLHLTLLDLRERERDAWEKLRLIDAEKRAREASDSKDKLITMLSHELRTPLTPVLAAASAYSRAKHLEPNVREVFGMIQRNVAAEARLIDDLLDATGLVRGKLRVAKRSIDLHALVLECLEASGPTADLKRVTLSHTFDAAFHIVDGDPLRLGQVLSNLLSNALKFTPAGGAIRVQSWNRDGKLVVEVQDNGVGFEPSEAPRLFASFEQLDATKHQGGLGLGLAISKGLVELHGGTITAASAGRDQGARFLLELPALATPAGSEHEAEQVQAPAGGSGVVPRRRLLLVEPDEQVARQLQRQLEERGFVVVAAGSIQAASAEDMRQIDAVVSDLVLPDGDGAQLLAALPRGAELPTVALSGYDLLVDVEAAQAAGFELHFAKPVDVDKLVAALNAVFSRPAREQLGKLVE